MKKIIFIAIFAFSVQITFAQNPNPFKSIGKPAPEFLSLTNGKYPEIFENDTLRKIGSVMFNTRTNKIKYFIETDTMYSEATLQPEIVSRWLSRDPLARKYPSHSPYNFVNNSPILLVDPNGKEWVNAHSVRIAQLNKQLLDTPNDKQLQRQLVREQKSEILVKDYLQDLKSNDVSLYNYIDNLKVIDKDGNTTNIKVNVSSDARMNGNNGQTAETKFSKLNADNNVEPALYNGSGIASPNSLSSQKKEKGFDVTIYGKTSFGDERLSNEAGDVMYYMEYNQDAFNEKSNSEYFENGGGGKDAYMNSGSGAYSNKVQATYKQRKKDGSGKSSENNPYPLKK